jgi:hypothetical protein
MQAARAARIFHYWAAAEGLMSQGPLTPSISAPAEFAFVVPITDMGKQVLRAKQIESIGFNDVAAEIHIFTKRVAPASKRQLAALPKTVDDIKISYRQGVQTPISPVSTIPFGAVYSIRNITGATYYSCGSSISVGNNREAGTLGALVRAIKPVSCRAY